MGKLDDDALATAYQDVDALAIKDWLSKGRDVIAFVGKEHWVRVRRVFTRAGKEFAEVFDPEAGGTYEQLLTSFNTRMTANNAIVVIAK